GGPNAIGKTINIPLPPNTSDEGYLSVIKNVVLPILDDFKPDLIINSAGQDNHFSDPITNMNFSAQGYAELTSLLKPDIAVLEGGYSIEGALPYVNLGIVLAMAGIDYSKVKEPAYNPAKLRQSTSITRVIEQTEEKILSYWEQREKIKEQAQANKTFDERNRTIYYDTDSISERQNEKIRICPDCGGTFRIDSSSDSGHHILAIHIPLKACKDCVETGYEWFETATARNYDKIFLQDRTEDKYLER
ncbi:MAG: histone deacetylase, partial [Deltaproteobacteria bacterium]|nr:histone deacetylase [Deltaproteobacteria bacterium]